MKIHLHQTHHSIGDTNAIHQYFLKQFDNEAQSGIHIFPELFLTGYPLQDLCLQRPFINKYLDFLSQIQDWSEKNYKQLDNTLILMGGLDYTMDDSGVPSKIKNTVYSICSIHGFQKIYTKMLLPNYDIYDEKKYFTPGQTPCIFNFNSKNIGILICEDMWHSNVHHIDPVKNLIDFAKESQKKLDLVVNLSASPFHIGKLDKRILRGKEISAELNCPFAYVNRVGGEDEILFDGASFVVSNQKVLIQGACFSSDILAIDLTNHSSEKISHQSIDVRQNSWEDLFQPQLSSSTPPQIQKHSNDNLKTIIQALTFGLQEYASKTKFKNFLVALSGGIDSALVLAILHLAKKPDQKIEAVFMPGNYSASESYDLAYQMCSNLNINFKCISIKFFHSAIRNGFKDSFGEELHGLANENIQSRLRGSLLYARSNQSNALVLNTSNKSELAVGYSTLYGDSVGGISLLGDLYKTEVYELANFINSLKNKIIPEGIISRSPTAELRENQKDEDSLPPYSVLDAILEGILSYRLGIHQLHKLGFDKKTIENVYQLYLNSEYKRNQFCPIIKLKAKSFGFGYRTPICKNLL